MTLLQRRYLFVSVFISGMTTLGAELSASRLLGTVFGTSNIVWANIIGLMLLYLTIGYFVGGKIADRYPDIKVFYRILCWGAFAVGMIPFIARPVLRASAQAVLNINAPLLVGSFGVIVIVFAIPITLLGTVSPFAIRLAIEEKEGSGTIAGRMYAISTLGSLIGTFLPVLVLIPTLGTNLTFITFSGVLLVFGLVGLALIDIKQMAYYAWMPAALALMAIFALPNSTLRPPPAGADILYEDESAYNYIQVARWGDANILLLNEGQGIHSMYFPDYPDYLETQGTWDFYLAAPFFNEDHSPDDVDSMAMIGLAGGTTPKQYTQVFGPIPIDGVEIDPDIVEAGREYFAMNEENLEVIIQDGRYVMAVTDNTYDVVAIDAYKLPYIPWNLSTVEFFEQVNDNLNEDGVVAINVGRTVTDRRLIAAFAATLSEVYASVHVIDVPNTCNSIMVATRQPTSADNLLTNRDQLDEESYPLLYRVLGVAHSQIRETPDEGIIFTDDKAAVEQLTDLILVNFVLSGDTSLPCA